MIKVFSVLLFILIGFQTYTQSPEIYFMNANFNSPTSPYLETYLSFIGNSVVFVENENGNFQSEFEITVFFQKNDEIRMADKYFFKSPEISDTSKSKPNFIDQQRYSLSNGIYNVKLSINDINSGKPEITFMDFIEIGYNSEDLQFSDIQLIEQAVLSESESITTKNNYNMIPYISNFYPQNMNSLMFYVEIYNSDKSIEDDFILRYYIEKFETGLEIDNISRFRRFSPGSINPFIGELNIESLASGNYNLILEIRDRENKLLKSKEFFFQRSSITEKSEDDIKRLSDFEFKNVFPGTINSEDSLRKYISSLRPIANSHEVFFIDHQMNISSKESLQNYFYNFWLARNPANPNRSWMIYKEQVDFVNASYTTFISKGYQTDRGRVYLQYGTPGSVYISKHEPSAYPYEIWHYTEIANERNKRFVFYNPSFGQEDYTLLHSELTGEIKNPNWERMLHGRDNIIYDFDQTEADDHWGRRARDEFRK